MRSEILRRLNILSSKQVPQNIARSLRGGMQNRLQRQQINRYSNEIKKEKTKLYYKLLLLDAEEEVETLDIFKEPKLNKIRRYF